MGSPVCPVPRVVPVAKRTATMQGETVEQAVILACRSLGLNYSQVTTVVLDEGKKSMMKSKRRPAQVRVTEK
jgi:predicted RNA-binding protein Jag